MDENLITHQVDPARLAPGAWCHRAQKTLGQGDIAASYSADRIGMSEPIRKPFAWQGALWVSVGTLYRPGQSQRTEIYRLMDPRGFDGQPLSYREKTLDGDAARGDLSGFYHGMTVRHAGVAMVLVGPPVFLVAGESLQKDLFG